MSSLFTLLKTTFNNFITEPAREPVRMRFTQVYVFLVQDYSFSRFISSLGRRSSARSHVVGVARWRKKNKNYEKKCILYEREARSSQTVSQHRIDLGKLHCYGQRQHIERTEDNIFHIQFESRSNRTTAEGKSVKNFFLIFPFARRADLESDSESPSAYLSC